MLCFFPLGIAGIVKSAAVGRRWAEGDYAGAQRAAVQARNLVILTAMVGFVVIFLIAMVATVGPPGGSS
ncbi:CD225/dispanin family protein [Gordonia sp. PP30]|nr:CD225/dispanin family protein [Gordonia sp. PP30]